MAETKQQDAIALLKEDPRTVADLFEKFEKATGDGRKQAIAEEICLDLSVHAQIEEEIFYPAAREALEEYAAAQPDDPRPSIPAALARVAERRGR